MAYVECPKIPNISVEWYANTTVSSIKKEQRALRIRTQVLGKTYTFSVTFPKLGGVRLVQKTGFFSCDNNAVITYSGKKVLRMTANGQTALFRKDETLGFVLDILNADGQTVFSFNGASILFGLDGNKIKKLKKVKLLSAFQNSEALYGLGERYNTFNQVGHDALIWNADTYIHEPWGDDGADHNEAYKNVPLLHSTKGYTLFINSMYGAWADFGKTVPHEYSFDFNGPTADFFVFTRTPRENLLSYADLTGHCVLPPKWAFQYWMGGASTQWSVNPAENINGKTWQEVLQSYIDGYKAMGIPHISACYGEGAPSEAGQEGYDIAATIGMRMFRWNRPALYLPRDLNEDFVEKVIGSKKPEALPIVTAKGYKRISAAHCSGWFDYTHPNAKPVIKAHYEPFFKWGVKGAMLDYGEYVRTDALLYNGEDGNTMHNLHTYIYNKTMREIFEEQLGDDYVLFSRSGCAGSQSQACQFGGDQASRFYGLLQAYYCGLNAMASGYNMWGSDIAGGNGDSTPELYLRWVQFGTFSPFMRAHGFGKPRNPWEYGNEGITCFQKHFWWRENMLDYVYSTAVRAHLFAEPTMAAMTMAFPDEALAAVDTQYMFGNELLVAPILTEGRQCRKVQFPKGNWYNLWTAAREEGDRTVLVAAPWDTIPVFLRAGTAIKLDVAESLHICDSMADGRRVPVLLTTPADAKRTMRQYVDKNTFMEFVTDTENGVHTIQNVNGITLEAVLMYGVQATNVLADGKEVSFTVDGNKTVVKTPNSFTTLQIS